MRDFSVKNLHAAMKLVDTADNITFNIDKQAVRIPGNKGIVKTVKRTVYRVKWEGDILTGRVLRKNDPENIWVPYEYNRRWGVWEEQ